MSNKKFCFRCDLSKNVNEFSKRIDGANNNVCRECKRIYDRQYHANRPEGLKQRKVKLQRKRIRTIRLQLTEYKKLHSCKCGEDHIACLDFHHISDKKEINIADTIKRGWPFTRILEEIKKCIIICSNCHRKIHYKE